ncbi:amidohydrolase [Corynebacterium tuscaniense]|uniref:amidohydrolase n=1 Tax=Corynebacterium tuscaniense TaxID=302449 RepID=UPI00050EF131|nr:amidohydrolase [Corynebacterium tuscaniense]KGF22444.1 N-acyl-L-amino acid amidohydrolase [Corynebacterium tuscaniense DNF00037]
MGLSAQIDSWFTAHRDEIIGWRRHLHANPEVSHHEVETTAFIAQTLRDHGLEPHLFPETGLYVDIGPEDNEKLAFRADIDALRVDEVSGLPFASRVPGVSHSCGHDVHTTICLALACALSMLDLPFGIRIIFQPAEEVMDGGAPDVIKWGGLDGVACIYAVHAEPKIRVGQIGVRVGAITSAADVLRIAVNGPGGHTSRPHLTNDVVYALGSLVTQLPGLLSRRVDPRTGTVLVFGQIEAGIAPNAVPKTGRVGGTIRTQDIGTWRTLEPLMEKLVADVVAPTGCSHELTYIRGVPPVMNDDVATSALVEAARAIDPHAVIQAPQSSGGEDFSWYLEQVPGSMARLGCWSGTGQKYDLHRGDIDIDERCIDVGVRLFGSVVERFGSMQDAQAAALT